jgi:hypothetical protein
MPIMTLTLNPIDVEAVQKMLGDCKTAPGKVISRALNKTMTGIKTDASTEIRAILNAKKADVDDTFRVTSASVADMSCKFVSTGRPLPLMTFGARQTTKGVSVQVKKTVARAVIPGTFLATMKSGHQGVFWRKWHQRSAMTGLQARASKVGYFWSSKAQRFLPMRLLPESYRLPITELFSSRVPDVLSDPPVINAVLGKANARLVTNLDREVNYELSKMQ